jgi:5-formyltetrahydrofolate cyclo-ligase
MRSKQELRAKLRGELKSLSPDCFYNEGKRAAERIAAFPPWQKAQQILIFLSLPDEIDTVPLLELAFAQNKAVFAPKICGDSLDFYKISSFKNPGMALGPGAWGIREPDATTASKFAAGSGIPTLIVTPGLAFDRQGRRLGRGKGFYDRFFASLDRTSYFALGLCLESQILPEIPVDSRDKTMDAICTGGELFAIVTEGGMIWDE